MQTSVLATNVCQDDADTNSNWPYLSCVKGKIITASTSPEAHPSCVSLSGDVKNLTQLLSTAGHNRHRQGDSNKTTRFRLSRSNEYFCDLLRLAVKPLSKVRTPFHSPRAPAMSQLLCLVTVYTEPAILITDSTSTIYPRHSTVKPDSHSDERHSEHHQ